jgi:glycosyltransferase involved in cell wall biosynthesis
VGRLRRKKNLGLLLEAFASAASCAGRQLVLAGPDGDAAPELRARARRADLVGRVDFPGHVADERLLALYRGAACVVFPSAFEGFGLPVLEAMQCGAPVVTSNTSSLPEVVGHAAICVDPTDEDALAQAMTNVLVNSDLATELRRRGFERAKRFTWRRTVDNAVAAYDEMLSRAAC